jgi:hypothetical protein
MTNWAIDYLRLLLSPSDEYMVLQSSGSSKEFVLNDEPFPMCDCSIRATALFN